MGLTGLLLGSGQGDGPSPGASVAMRILSQCRRWGCSLNWGERALAKGRLREEGPGWALAGELRGAGQNLGPSKTVRFKDVLRSIVYNKNILQQRTGLPERSPGLATVSPHSEVTNKPGLHTNTSRRPAAWPHPCPTRTHADSVLVHAHVCRERRGRSAETRLTRRRHRVGTG